MKIQIRLLFILLMSCPGLMASDHADPIRLESLESGITGLFAFPREENLIVILNVRRALGNPESIPGINEYLFEILIDWDSEISYEDAGKTVRFGGGIIEPATIAENATLSMRLDDSLNFDTVEIEGIPSDGVRRYSGVRDDPFIFPRFLGTNVVTMTFEIPFSSFPQNNDDFVIWATSSRNGKQIDHVGRSNRTMQPRFDFLNTLHPSEHLEQIYAMHESPGLIRDIARTYVEPVFAFRAYDFAPDVMIYSRRLPAGFPNGRLLTDDVASLTCEWGDCLLWELSWAATRSAMRVSTNELPFLDEFPYLADPHANPAMQPAPSLRFVNKVKLGLIAVLLALVILLPWVLLIRHHLKARRAS